MTDRETFNRFCAGKYPGLIAYAGLILKGEDCVWAEDVVQDVLFSVWKRHRILREDPEKVHAYLLKSVYNRCINYLKRNSSLRKYETEQSSFLEVAQRYYDPDNNPVIRYIFNRDLHLEIESSIETLPEKCREVFRLSYIEDIPHKEIAERLGISVRTVEAHIYNALKSVRISLNGI